MIRARSFVLAALLAPLAAGALSARSQVIVVDDGGGAGVDFTEISEAVAVAGSGDLVLVKTGNYAPFSIFGKGLSVVADNQQTVFVNGQILVQDVPAGALVVLRGLSTGPPSGHGLLVRNCAGAVRVEECSFSGQPSPTQYQNEMEFSGARIGGSADVALLGSTFQGGNGKNVGFFGEPWSGAAGVRVDSSSIVVVDCELRGGHGADAPIGDSYSGGSGGDGI